MKRSDSLSDENKEENKDMIELAKRKRLLEMEVNADKYNHIDYSNVNDGDDIETGRKTDQKEEEESDDFSGDEEDRDMAKLQKQKISHLAGETEYNQNDVTFLSSEDHALDENKKEIEFTRFNLKEENENGYFDATGFYHEKGNKDEKEIDMDVFARDLAKQKVFDISALKKMESKEKPKEKEISENMYFVRICSYLGPDESPNDVIRKYGKEIDKAKPKKVKSKRHKMAFEIDDEKIPTVEEIKYYRKTIEMITECCSALMEEYPNIYDMKREDLSRLVIMNYSVSQKQWEYKWQVREDGQPGESSIYGVFNTAQMIEWHQQGCFVSDPLIRRVEKKEEKKEEKEEGKTGFSAADFDADFDAEDPVVEKTPAVKNPWIPASKIDYFTD